mmetsp:Transcript_29158/g.53416  ORF Transcript_29158/g.53416 Transcript_29158/m.53416 type:complete len:80 (-) Transcript_29158:222-461(-)
MTSFCLSMNFEIMVPFPTPLGPHTTSGFVADRILTVENDISSPASRNKDEYEDDGVPLCMTNNGSCFDLVWIGMWSVLK